MKMNKFFVTLLVVAISLFVVACGGEIKKQGPGTVIEKENSKTDDKKESSETVTEEEISGTDNKNEIIMAGGGNTVKGVCQFGLGGIYVTSRIEPSIITESSSYYDVKTEGNIYIDVTLSMENSSSKDKPINDIITTRIKLNNNEYTCFSLVESIDGSNLEKNGLVEPNGVRNIHYVAEVPIAEATGEMEVILTVDGKDFSREFNLEDIMSWNEYEEEMGW